MADGPGSLRLSIGKRSLSQENQKKRTQWASWAMKNLSIYHRCHPSSAGLEWVNGREIRSYTNLNLSTWKEILGKRETCSPPCSSPNISRTTNSILWGQGVYWFPYISSNPWTWNYNKNTLFLPWLVWLRWLEYYPGHLTRFYPKPY